MGITYKEKHRLSLKDKRENVFNKYGGKCAYCGCQLSDDIFQVDHIIPKRRGANDPFHSNHDKEKGTDHIDNLLPACCSCNASKSDLNLEDFRDRVKDRVKRLNAYSTEYNIAKRFGLVAEINTDVIFYFENFITTENNG